MPTRHTNIVLFNFGGPTCDEEVYPFLKRLFSDPFILRSPWLGTCVREFLATRIAKGRAAQSVEDYSKIGFSKIGAITQSVADQLAKKLQANDASTKVYVVNRYTAPFAKDVVKQIDWHQSRNIFLTLYPHLSHSTVVSSFRDFDLAYIEAFGKKDFAAFRIFSWWYHPAAMRYTAKALQRAIDDACTSAEDDANLLVLFSAHGLPKKYYDNGDPYVDEVLCHFEELKSRMELPSRVNVDFQLSYQSRVGPMEWVGPYTETAIAEYPQRKGARILLVPISFTSDHIETLFEMDMVYQEQALKAGFSSYSRMPMPNDDPEFVDVLAQMLGHDDN